MQPACYGWYDDGTAVWSQNYQWLRSSSLVAKRVLTFNWKTTIRVSLRPEWLSWWVLQSLYICERQTFPAALLRLLTFFRVSLMCETCVLLPHTSPIIMRYNFQKMACLLLNNNRLLYLFINIDKGYCVSKWKQILTYLTFLLLECTQASKIIKMALTAMLHLDHMTTAIANSWLDEVPFKVILSLYK